MTGISGLGNMSITDRWQMHLSTGDSDGDGAISQSEFEAELSAAQSQGFRAMQGDTVEIFSSIDTDSDGYISETEFMEHKPPRGEEAMQQIMDERATAMGTTIDVSSMWQRILDQDDTNSDGAISQSEFMVNSAQATGQAVQGPGFDAFDTDSDGVITEEEFVSFEAESKVAMGGPPPPPPPPPAASEDEDETSSIVSALGDTSDFTAAELFSLLTEQSSEMTQLEEYTSAYYQARMASYQTDLTDMVSNLSITV